MLPLYGNNTRQTRRFRYGNLHLNTGTMVRLSPVPRGAFFWRLQLFQWWGGGTSALTVLKSLHIHEKESLHMFWNHLKTEENVCARLLGQGEEDQDKERHAYMCTQA